MECLLVEREARGLPQLEAVEKHGQTGERLRLTIKNATDCTMAPFGHHLGVLAVTRAVRSCLIMQPHAPSKQQGVLHVNALSSQNVKFLHPKSILQRIKTLIHSDQSKTAAYNLEPAIDSLY